LIQAGSINEFTALLERYVELAKQHRLVVHDYQADLLRIALHLLRGEWAEAEERIERTFEHNQQISRNDRFTAAEGVYGTQMFMLNRELGRLQAMAPLVRRLIEEGRLRMWAPGLMAMCTEVGLLDHARATLDSLAADDFAQIPRDDMWLASIAFCAETCARLKDVDRAGRLYSLLLPYVEQTVNNPGAVCFGSAALYLGMLAETLDRAEEANQHYVRAVENSRAMNAWPALARAQVRLGHLLLHSADSAADGRRLIVDAEQLAIRLNMQGLLAEIGEALNEDASQLPDGLSPREVDVLKLLAIGRSNKDISKVLAISLSTVASHVRSILTKTGCANRTEAAAYAMRNDLA